MRIRSNFYVSLDGFVSTPDGRPIQLLLPGFAGAASHGLPDFLAACEAVVMGRTTFEPALGAPRWPWTQPVFVLTSTPLPEGTPEGVTAAPTAAELVQLMRDAGIDGDVHLVGGPSTVEAFHAIGAFDELHLHVAPVMVGDGGTRLTPPLLPVRFASSRTFRDGVVELRYLVGDER